MEESNPIVESNFKGIKNCECIEKSRIMKGKLMVKVRIHKRKGKRGERKGILLALFLFFILFPYIISSFSEEEKKTFNLENTPGQIYVIEKRIWGGENIPLEEYLVGMMAATIPAEYEMEKRQSL